MNYKDLAAHYQEEIKAESVSTHKCLERIPESTYSFKPHERSMEMGYLVLLVAEIPKWISSIIIDSVIDFATYPHFKLSNTAAMLQHYEENLKGALGALENITEDQLKKDFELRNSGQVLISSPKLKIVGETINHWVHHRGQLTVYMRLNDIAVPSIYGPSADDRGPVPNQPGGSK
jgi:uncharacterized damage-inducible protein DinB